MKRIEILFLTLSILLSACQATLIEAIRRDDTNTVDALLAKGADVNAKERFGLTALMVAAHRGRVDTVQLLLAKGADVNAKEYFGLTPLMIASEQGRADVVHALLANGADVDAKSAEGRTPLMIAVQQGSVNIMQLLLAKGADVNAKDGFGRTTLMVAVARGRVGIVQLLLGMNADVVVRDMGGQTALTLAIQQDRNDMVQLFKKAEAERIEQIVASLKGKGAKQQEKSIDPLPPEDVDLPPRVKVTIKQNAYAVVIGVELYKDLPPAEFAERDAETVKNYLVRVLGYPEENVKFLTNDQATRARVESLLETWLPNQQPRGAVFVYYSGHGAPDPSTGERYLVPADGDPNDVKRTAYPLSRLAKALAALPAQEVIVVVDACFSGQPGTRSVLAAGVKPMVIAAESPWSALGEKGVVFSAGDQVSTVYQEKRHGLFTYFFLKGIKEAIENGEQVVEVRELFDYLRPKVTRTARRRNVEQVPGLWPALEQLGEKKRLPLVALP